VQLPACGTTALGYGTGRLRLALAAVQNLREHGRSVCIEAVPLEFRIPRGVEVEQRSGGVLSATGVALSDAVLPRHPNWLVGTRVLVGVRLQAGEGRS
jgi:hypothetical protein